jgi:hypothetical protein
MVGKDFAGNWVHRRRKDREKILKQSGFDGLQAGKAIIKPTCRKIHGTQLAFEKACEILKEKYMRCTMVECNKDATYDLVLLLKRVE